MSKLRKYLFGLILAMAAMAAAGQNDSLYQVIISTPTDYQMIERGRDLMRIKLQEEDFEGCREIERFLLAEYGNSDNVVVLWYEYVGLAFLQSDFDRILNIEHIQSLIDRRQEKGRPPFLQNNYYFEELNKKIAWEYKTIQSQIEESLLSQKEKDFLEILLITTLHSVSQTDFIDRTANAYKMDIFFRKYPLNDDMFLFLRNNLSESYRLTQRQIVQKEREQEIANMRFKPDGWGVGIDAFLGCGIFSENFKATPLFGFGIEGSYSSFILFLRGEVGFVNLKHDISSYKMNFTVDSSGRFYSFDLTLGYNVYNHKIFRIIPFAGIALSSMKISTETHYHYRIPYTFSPAAGLNIDFKLFRNVEVGTESFIPIRLQYKYGFLKFDRRIPEFTGGIHQITVGIGFVETGAKMKKQRSKKSE